VTFQSSRSYRRDPPRARDFRAIPYNREIPEKARALQHGDPPMIDNRMRACALATRNILQTATVSHETSGNDQPWSQSGDVLASAISAACK